MNNKEVILSDGNTIGFNSAIIATGSSYPTLSLAKSNTVTDYTERDNEIQKENNLLKEAKSILIIGGGVVGVEFAGEISSTFPNKKVTLAHSSNTLLDNLKPKMQEKAYEQLTSRGVDIKFNRRLKKDGDQYKCSISNETIKADITYVCVGLVPNTNFLKKEMSTILNDRGLVKVDNFMKVEGYDNIYALGDCSNLDNDNKNGYVAAVQGRLLTDMLIKTLNGQKVKPYKKQPLIIVTTTGTDTGVAQLPFAVTTSKFMINTKQKDLGNSNMYKMLGTVPDKLNSK